MEGLKVSREDVREKDYKDALANIIDTSKLEVDHDNGQPTNQYTTDVMLVLELVERDLPQQVIHEHSLKQFGKCPQCNSFVSIRFHSLFCGACGNRLKWKEKTND